METFDLGRVLQTAETIKGLKRQSTIDKLREQALQGNIAQNEQAMKIASAQEERAGTQFTQEQQITNTKLLNAASAELAQDPSTIERWGPTLEKAGVISSAWRQTAPEQIQALAKQTYASTSAALGALQAPKELPNSVREFQYAQKNPEFMEFLKNTGSSNSPSSVQEWRFYSGLQPQDQKRFLELKRNPNMIVKDVGSVPTVIAPSVSGTEVTPLSSLPEEADAKAKIAGAEAGAKTTATAEAEKPAKNLELSKTLATYEQARQGLLSGLEGTETGPLAGRIPAVTSGQQIAEGSVAAMAPILKQLFRSAGEGVFTDRDQQLLIDMVPKRTDTPEARKAKMQNIDNIVRAKLGTAVTPAPKTEITATGPNGEKLYLRNGQWVKQ